MDIGFFILQLVLLIGEVIALCAGTGSSAIPGGHLGDAVQVVAITEVIAFILLLFSDNDNKGTIAVVSLGAALAIALLVTLVRSFFVPADVNQVIDLLRWFSLTGIFALPACATLVSWNISK